MLSIGREQDRAQGAQRREETKPQQLKAKVCGNVNLPDSNQLDVRGRGSMEGGLELDDLPSQTVL